MKKYGGTKRISNFLSYAVSSLHFVIPKWQILPAPYQLQHAPNFLLKITKMFLKNTKITLNEIRA